MLKPLSLSRKIALGFGVVLLLHLTVALMAHFGLENASRDLAQLDRRRELVDRIVGLDITVGHLQRDILNYTQTGHPALAGRIRVETAGLREELDDIAARASPTDRPLLKRMQASLTRYGDQFEAMVVDRDRRKRLLEVELFNTSSLLEEALLSLRYATTQAAGDEDRLASEAALLRFSNSRLEIQNYISQLDSASIRNAKQELREVEQQVQILETGTARGNSTTIRTVRELVPQLETQLTELVQVTRGYLHLLNVVLAGEATEFEYESGVLRDQNRTRLGELTRSIADEQLEFQAASHWISIVTILIGFVASWLIGKSVVQPLDQISGTLTCLAAGDASAQIPCTDRLDEVGEMARAAEIFRAKNAQTDELLQETRRLAERHEEMIVDLERSNRELDDFAYVASHDLKAPLRAISSLSEWIEEDLPQPVEPGVQEHLRALRSRTGRMGQLLSDLLTYSLASRAELVLEEVSLTELGRDVWDLAGNPDGMAFSVSGEEIVIETARVPLEQVLANLMSNAVKHHDRLHGSIELQIRSSGEDAIELRLVDDGPGIPEDHRERAFEPFKTLRSRDDFEASGIGLALVKKHVEHMGGSVRIESTGGDRGCCFVVLWPRKLQLDTRQVKLQVAEILAGG